MIEEKKEEVSPTTASKPKTVAPKKALPKTPNQQEHKHQYPHELAEDLEKQQPTQELANNASQPQDLAIQLHQGEEKIDQITLDGDSKCDKPYINSNPPNDAKIASTCPSRQMIVLHRECLFGILQRLGVDCSNFSKELLETLKQDPINEGIYSQATSAFSEHVAGVALDVEQVVGHVEDLETLGNWLHCFVNDSNICINHLRRKQRASQKPIRDTIQLSKAKLKINLAETSGQEQVVRKRFDELAEKTKIAKDTFKQANSMGYQHRDLLESNLSQHRDQRGATLRTLETLIASRNSTRHDLGTVTRIEKATLVGLDDRDLLKVEKDVCSEIILKVCGGELQEKMKIELSELISLRRKELDLRRQVRDAKVVYKSVNDRVCELVVDMC